MIATYIKDSTVYMIAQRKLDANDHENLIPMLMDHIESHSQVSWYIEMENFEGWTASAYWKGIELELPDEERLKRVALVGNIEWQELFMEVLMPFSRAHIKFFGPEEKNPAKKWVNSHSSIIK